jgi:hypothetical protein
MRHAFVLAGPLALAAALLAPAAAAAWGDEGHEVVAAIAYAQLAAPVRTKVDAILATDTDPLTAHDIEAEATWADRYRNAHRETASWHFVNIELDGPDIDTACFGHPAQPPLASQGPTDDCVVDKIDAFARELKDPATTPGERLLALKFLLHFVGDLHQPLHAADHHDKGGNCVLVALDGSRTVNLHSYWDSVAVGLLGKDPGAAARSLEARISRAQRKAWQKGGAKSWALESYNLARNKVYTIGSGPGCNQAAPIALPRSYGPQARSLVALQLSRAGVRLAWLLNHALGPDSRQP